jgi:hypothetical protein
MTVSGGCACGELRYISTSEPEAVGYCHCLICQKTSGAPALVFAEFSAEDFEYTRGTPAIYQSSSRGHREYCASCGTQIAYREDIDPETVDVNCGSLDEPGQYSPEYHIWCESQLEWFKPAPELPHFKQGIPNDSS